MTSLSNADVASQINETLLSLKAVPIDGELPDEPSMGRLRRYRRTREDDSIGILTLLDVDGLLLWEDGPVSPAVSGARRRWRGPSLDGKVVTQVKYSKSLGQNDVNERLIALDQKLTPLGPARLIEYFDGKAWVTKTEEVKPVAKGRVLLFIHGTFSNTANLMNELRGPDDKPFLKGQKFLEAMAARYDQILGYDHYTLSRTPVVNAAWLARQFADSKAAIDIVCHSRGGIVTRWFCEHLDRMPGRRRRVVFVGCPLQGTSLADPTSLRNGLTLLTNVGKVIGGAFQLVPFLAAAGGLMQILSSVGAFAAKTPVVDAGVGLVPGLAAMSRIRNNAELDMLNTGAVAESNRYAAIHSDFDTEDVTWKFWKLFNWKKLADLGTDYLVFNQANDLVVDTGSMTYHAFGPEPDLKDADRFCFFEPEAGVHHTAYFQVPRTVDFLLKTFERD